MPYCLLVFEKEIILKEQLAKTEALPVYSPARKSPANQSAGSDEERSADRECYCLNVMVQSSLLETVHSLEFLQKIQRSLGSSTVALFALFDAHGNERLEPAGTGTLVVIRNRYYILTAAHVWERIESALRFGISLIENRDHKTWIDPKTIAPTLVKPPGSGWNEWGPDVALLEIPEVIVGGIEARRVFEDLTTPGKMLNAPAVEFWAVMGTPKELGTFTPHHAEVQIAAFFGIQNISVAASTTTTIFR